MYNNYKRIKKVENISLLKLIFDSQRRKHTQVVGILLVNDMYFMISSAVAKNCDRNGTENQTAVFVSHCTMK